MKFLKVRLREGTWQAFALGTRTGYVVYPYQIEQGFSTGVVKVFAQASVLGPYQIMLLREVVEGLKITSIYNSRE